MNHPQDSTKRSPTQPRSSGIYQHTTSPEQRALASFDHVARTGGAWGARLAAVKSRELLERKPRNAR